MKIKIQNFQILGSVSLQVEGLTALIGTTHSGKSAVMRAVESALYNPRGSESIKAGSAFTEVSLQFSWNEKPVRWTWAKQKSSQLDVNGQLYKKIGSAPPEDLLKQVGFEEVKVGDITFRPHFQRQLTDLFGISEKSTTLFNLLLAFADFERLPGIRKRIDKDLKDLNVNRLATEQEVNSYAEQIEKFSAFLKDAQSSKGLQTFDKMLDQFRRYYEIATLVEEYEALEQQDVGLGQLLIGVRKAIPVIGDMEADTSKLTVLDTSVFKHDEVERYKVYADEIHQRLYQADQDMTNLVMNTGKVGDADDLITEFCLIDSAHTQCVDALRKVSVAQTGIRDVVDRSEWLMNADQNVTFFESAVSTVSELEDRLGRIDPQLQDIIDQINAIDECPECGAPIKQGHYHEPTRTEGTTARAGDSASGTQVQSTGLEL